MFYVPPYRVCQRLPSVSQSCLIYFILFALACPSLQAQLAPQTDSLQTALTQSTGEERINTLLELGDQIQRANIDSALQYTHQAIDASMLLEDELLIAKAHKQLGILFMKKGNNPEALQNLLKAKNSFEQIGDLKNEALTLKNLGALYEDQSEYNKALEYYFSALNLSEQLNDEENVPDILLSIGTINERLEQHERSIEFYDRALKMAEQNQNASKIAIISMAMGDLYAKIKQPDNALEAMMRALSAAEKLPGSHAKATVLMSMSSVYKNKKSYQQAQSANKQALSLAREMSDKVLESLALKNIATLYREQGDFENANKHLLETQPLLNEVGLKQLVIENENRIAHNYLDMGNSQKSIEHGEWALQQAKNARAFDLAREALHILANAYQEVGDLEKALDVQKQLVAVKDSLFNQAQSRQIAEMQTRYETRKKEQEIALLQQEQEKATLIRNAFAAGLVLIVIIGFLIYNRQRLKINKNRTELENTRLKEQKLKQDLEFKNKQLTTHSLNLVQKNEVMKELKESIHEIKLQQNGKVQERLTNLEHLVDYSFNLDDDWEEFKLYFEEIHTGFFETLKTRYPDLTSNELRLSALVKLNLTIKEIATIMGISPDSVKTARYRLRKKLGMETEENLTDFMMSVEKEAKT